MNQDRGHKLPKNDDGHTLIDVSQLFMICFIHCQKFIFRLPRQKVNFAQAVFRRVELQTLRT